jgi:glycosyltransferase involved in cell wall biosynthesis
MTTTSAGGPRKILHVVGAMNRGGVETWLMHIFRSIDRNAFQFHFLVHTNAVAAYDEEILSLGGKIHRAKNPRNFLSYASNFRTLVQREGPFDVLHSHVYWYSGCEMRLGYNAGIPVRIAQSHTAVCAPTWKIQRRFYEKLMRSWILRYSTHLVGVSKKAVEALFGRESPKPTQLVPYGLDFDRFMRVAGADEIRARLGIPPERKIIGQVARFAAMKNHSFTVEFFADIISSGLDSHLVFVGDGPLLSATKSLVQARGLSDRCTFAGLQADVAPWLSAMDVFVLPSQWEGLPLSVLEAQAAGVPVIASTGVTEDVDVIPKMVQHVPLSAGAAAWADAVKQRLREPTLRKGNEARLLQNSQFGLQTCLKTLTDIYRDGVTG